MSSELDAARLRMAQRAFRAVEPSEAEVEQGVRKALSAMRRSQMRRRASVTPAVVVAVLAFGTLAYANPAHFVRWVASLVSSTESVQAPRAPAAVPPKAGESAVAIAPPASTQAEAAPSTPDEPAAPDEAPAPSAAVAAEAPAASATTAALPSGRSSTVARAAAVSRGRKASAPRRERATWAEVSSALAAKDTQGALSALQDLARHGDATTRAKAELGIAQLSLARGDHGKACASARLLVKRKDVPRRVLERATALLESCER